MNRKGESKYINIWRESMLLDIKKKFLEEESHTIQTNKNAYHRNHLTNVH